MTNTRKIEYGNKSVLCQILNWQNGEPPRYIVCHPIDPQYPEIREDFVAKQRMGAWMKEDLTRALLHYGNHCGTQETTEPHVTRLDLKYVPSEKVIIQVQESLKDENRSQYKTNVWTAAGDFLCQKDFQGNITRVEGIENLTDFEVKQTFNRGMQDQALKISKGL